MILNLVKKYSGENVKGYIKKLDEKYLEQMMYIQEINLKKLKKPEFCVPLTRDEKRALLGKRGITYGVIVEEKLISYYSILIPDRNENLGIDIGLKEEELCYCANLEITHTLSEYQGNKLQKILGSLCIEELRKERSEFIYILGTIAPENYSSLVSTFYHGLVIANLKIKYQNHLRYILYKNYKEDIKIDKSSIIYVLGEDLDKQKKLLKQGFVGFCVKREEEKTFILMAKVKNNLGG